jgi:hypothetical protein
LGEQQAAKFDVRNAKASRQMCVTENGRRPMKSDEAHRLSKFALTIIGANHDQSSEAEQAKKLELFRSRDGSVFADIYDSAIRKTWPVRSRQFSHLLARKYFEVENKIATLSQLKAAINQIEAQAQIDSPEREVFRRVGKFGARLYLDLADEKWSAIEIDASGWGVVQSPAVRFVRTPGMLPLPVPEKGGSIETLRSLVNLADEQDFVLVVASLIAAMHCDIPKPVIAIRGGAGSAKSSLVQILRGLIDPHDPPYTALPRTELKLRAAAAEWYLQAYDNISGLTVLMSDALCRFVTDGSNQPVIINGILDIIQRSDLSDRSVIIDCGQISDVQRRTQHDVMKAFAEARAQILGVLLDAVAHGLRTQAQAEVTGLPRMADFARTVAACEAIFWPAGTFRTAYDVNRAEVVEALIEADPVASAVRLLMVHRRFWEGQASDLDNMLRAITGNLGVAKYWPADPRILANTLRQVAPSLLKIGIEVRFHKSRDRDRKRLIAITASGPVDAAIKDEAILSSAASEKPAPKTEESRKDVVEDDQAPSFQPTRREPLAPSADTAKSDQPGATPSKATPQVADAADAEIKGTSVEFVRYIPGTRVPVLRYRTPSKVKRPKTSLKHRG